MEQYRLLAECLLPAHMLDWFDLKTVRVEKKGDTQKERAEILFREFPDIKTAFSLSHSLLAEVY